MPWLLEGSINFRCDFVFGLPLIVCKDSSDAFLAPLSGKLVLLFAIHDRLRNRRRSALSALGGRSYAVITNGTWHAIRHVNDSKITTCVGLTYCYPSPSCPWIINQWCRKNLLCLVDRDAMGLNVCFVRRGIDVEANIHKVLLYGRIRGGSTGNWE